MNTGNVKWASGVVTFVDDLKLQQSLLERPFLRPNVENITTSRVEKGDAWFWTFADSECGAAIERSPFR